MKIQGYPLSRYKQRTLSSQSSMSRLAWRHMKLLSVFGEIQIKAIMKDVCLGPDG